jgi:hypothetical protein
MPETRAALSVSMMGKTAGIGVPDSTRNRGVGVKEGVAVGVKVGVKVGSRLGVRVRVADGEGVVVGVGFGVAKKEREEKRQKICVSVKNETMTREA